MPHVYAIPWLMLAAAQPAATVQATSEAQASLVTPLVIVASTGMNFGTLAVSNAGTCIYDIAPDGIATKSGDSRCAFLSGIPSAAAFEVDCGVGSLVRMEVVYDNFAPTGSSFGASPRTMAIDGAAAGGAMQIMPCDSDGRSVVRVGGRLITSPGTNSGFSGRVGTIRLEVAYE